MFSVNWSAILPERSRFLLAIAGAMSGRSKHTEPGGKRGDSQGFGGLTATLEGNSVKISAAKDAKPGPHQVTVRDAKGKQATLNVSVTH